MTPTASGQRIDLSNVQGNVLRAYTFPRARFLFYKIGAAAAGRAWLGRLLPRVRSAALWKREEKPRWVLNVMLSWHGLAQLGVPEESLGSFPEAYRQGMAPRHLLLGDTGANAPERWREKGWPEPDDVDALVTLYALDATGADDPLPEALAWLGEQDAPAADLARIQTQHAGRLRDARGRPVQREHFGYTDGIGQPSIEASDLEPLPGQGSAQPNGTWRPIETGEFLLGHRNERGVIADGPQPAVLGHDGTYVVYRKLRQDVAAFRQFVAGHAHDPRDQAALRAKVMGRWDDGTPLMRSPDTPDAAMAQNDYQNDDFRYGSDPQGLICPVGAHIRRANPRDTLGFGGELVDRRRMIRRGISYGDPLPDDAGDDGADRGLIFICFQADLESQFEIVQGRWLNDGDIFCLGANKDLFGGHQDGSSTMILGGAPPRFLPHLPRVVMLEGGEYFFMPGIAGLRYLAEAGWQAPAIT